ncbi:MAG: hypothetical protein QG655_1748 [Actinomycetota bacterium]|nr:hypothetical protein [Actinomycetota bacterium]
MVNIGVCVGAAGFTLGLSLAGLCVAGAASADSTTTDSARTDAAAVSSAGPRADSPKATKRGARGGAVVKPSATTVKPAATARATQRTAAAVAGSVADGAELAAERAAEQVAGPAPAADVSPQAEPVIAAVGNAPSITIHNQAKTESIWVYNLTNTGNYSIPDTPWQAEPPAPAPPLPPDWVGPVEITAGSSAPITLAVFNAPAGSPGNRIYIVEGSAFGLPITSAGGLDPFYPPGFPTGDTFQNYSFLEYSLYPVDGGYEYTIDVSYIDEWSLPLQTKFTLNGADWSGAKTGKLYGFNDFDTVVSQLKAAGGPYGDLVWSGATPWDPQPPSTVKRIIGPDKVWTAQSLEPTSNFTMNVTGWVPASYSNFVQYGSYTDTNSQTVYPYAYNGTELTKPPTAPNPQDPNAQSNFDFWKDQVSAPGSTPYPIALRTAAIYDGFTTQDAGGVYGFFTYPNDEAAGQFTNIPTAVSLDIYVSPSSDGLSASLIPGGVWNYTSSAKQTGPWREVRKTRPVLSGSIATDTFINDSGFANARVAPLIDLTGPGGDIAVIDRFPLGATSTAIDFVDRAWFLGWGLGNITSQFVYERSTGVLYYDRDPQWPGYTSVLGIFSGVTDPESALFVL